jgi:hypothetical protein
VEKKPGLVGWSVRIRRPVRDSSGEFGSSLFISQLEWNAWTRQAKAKKNEDLWAADAAERKLTGDAEALAQGFPPGLVDTERFAAALLWLAEDPNRTVSEALARHPAS